MSIKEGVPIGGKKYELVLDQQVTVADTTLYRIRALKDFGTVKAGALGGFVASEHNLSQHGECWVFDEARVYDEAVISNAAQVRGRGCVHGHARISDRGQVLGNAEVFGHAWVFKRGMVFDNAKVFGRGQVRDDGLVYGNAIICDRARVLGHGQVCGNTRVDARTVVDGHEKDGRFSSDARPSGRGRGRPPSPPRLRP